MACRKGLGELTRGFRECAPRAFEVALHYVDAIRKENLDLVIDQSRALGHEVHTRRYEDLSKAGQEAVDRLDTGRPVLLAASYTIEDFSGPCADGDVPDVKTCAVINAALGTVNGLLVCRVGWAYPDFVETTGAKEEDCVILVVDDIRAPAIECARLRAASGVVEASVVEVVRRLVLSEAVLRPYFEVVEATVTPPPLPPGRRPVTAA
jgi:hypothetical protein